jgi:glycosyltransferase involved in cell wall biosynthesis
VTRPRRVAFLTSHPIQYQAPLFRTLAARPEVDLTVFFCADRGARTYHDPGFGTRLAWDVPLLDGYRSVQLTNIRRHGGPGAFFGLVNPSVVTALRRGRFDALIVHGWAYATNWLAFAACAWLGIPLLLRGESNGLREPRGWRRALKRIGLGWLLRQAAGVLAIGSLNRRFYERHGVRADRIFFAPYAVDNAFFRHAAAGVSRAALRREQGIAENATVFAFCGKLIGIKRPLDVLAAFERLQGRDRAALRFVGDGPLRGAIEARAAKVPNVVVTGFRNQHALPREYALADVLVLPSEFEPWGLVVNEALNFGLSVIASDQVGAAPDLVRAEDGGEIVPVGDIDRLAAAMRRTMDERALRPSGATKRVIDEWSLEQCADGIVEAVIAVGGRR